MLDGEIVIAQGGALDFEALQMRIHPAASRVALLAEEIPASIVFFDATLRGRPRPAGAAVPRAPRARSSGSSPARRRRCT